MRLFSSVCLSSAAHNHLDHALEPFRIQAGPHIRWTPTENWHITLSFYGNLPDGDTDALIEFLGTVASAHAPVTLRLSGAGSFNNQNLWIGVGGDTDGLRTLMADCLLDPDLRHRQRAHLTVGRKSATAQRTERQVRRTRARHPDQFTWAPQPVSLSDYVHALAIYSGPEFTVTSIQLVESIFGAGKAGANKYSTVAEFPLAPAVPPRTQHTTRSRM